MKTVVFIFLMCTSLYANTLILPDVVTQDHPDVQKVLVTGTGLTEKSSLNNALDMAVEKVVGTMVTGDTYIENGDLINSEIIKLAPSYVSSYKLLRVKNVNGIFKTSIEADVAKNKVAKKLSSLKFAVLEVADSDQAHNQLLADATAYNNNKDTVERLFKSSFKNLGNVMSVNITGLHYVTTEVKDGDIPFIVNFTIGIDRDQYEKQRAIIHDLLTKTLNVKYLGNMGTVEINKDNDTSIARPSYFQSQYDRKNRFFMTRISPKGYILDGYDLFELNEDMKMFILDKIANRQFASTSFDEQLIITLEDESGKTFFSDVQYLQTKDWIQHDDYKSFTQKNLYLVWDSVAVSHHNAFPITNIVPTTRTYAQLKCSMLYNDSWRCFESQRGDADIKNRSSILIPLFNLYLYSSGNMATGTAYTDTLQMQYRGKIALKDVDKLKSVSINIMNQE